MAEIGESKAVQIGYVEPTIWSAQRIYSSLSAGSLSSLSSLGGLATWVASR